MSAPAVESLLARLYADASFLAEFLADPAAVAQRSGLDMSEARAVAKIDPAELRLAAHSYGHKRASHARKKG